jgi:hypothetical protein
LKQIDFVSTNCATYTLDFDPRSMVGESISKIVVEVSEGIGDCIAEVDDVSLVYKFVLKG